MGSWVVTAFLTLSALVARGDEPITHPDTLPVQTVRVDPEYPAGLKAQRIVGAATLRGIIDEQGSVRDLVVENATQPEFGQAALAAAMQWKYHPATKGGRPRAVRVGLSMEFRLGPSDMEEFDRQRNKEELPPGPPLLGVEDLDDWPELKKEIRPKLPPRLRSEGRMGETVLNLIVDEDGNPRDVYTLFTSHAECAAAAEEVVRRWQFSPGRKASRAVRTRLEVSLIFFPESPSACGLRVRAGVRAGAESTPRLATALQQAKPIREVKNLTPPKISKQPPPDYPAEMLNRGLSGRALIELIIDDRGRVAHVRTQETSNPFFAFIAERAISHWQFKPARVDGHSVAARATQLMEFRVEH